MNKCLIMQKAPLTGAFSTSGEQVLYNLLYKSASQAACADLDSPRSAIDESLHRNKIRLECALLGYTDMLTDTTLLLSLSLAGYDGSGNSSLAADFASSSHVIIHLELSSIKRGTLPGAWQIPVTTLRLYRNGVLL